jgi:hypothetical protein
MVRGPQQRLPAAEFPSHAVAAFSKAKPAKIEQANFSETATRAFSRPTNAGVTLANVGFPDSASAAFGAVKQARRDDMPSAFASGSGSDSHRNDNFNTQAASAFGSSSGSGSDNRRNDNFDTQAASAFGSGSGSGNDNRRNDNFDTQAASAFGKKRVNKSMPSEVSSTYSARSNTLSHILSAALPDTPAGVVSVDYNKSALRVPKAAPTESEMFPALGSVSTTSMVNPKKSFADVIRKRAAADKEEAYRVAAALEAEHARKREEAAVFHPVISIARRQHYNTYKGVDEHEEEEVVPGIDDLDYVPPHNRRREASRAPVMDHDEDYEEGNDAEDAEDAE